ADDVAVPTTLIPSRPRLAQAAARKRSLSSTIRQRISTPPASQAGGSSRIAANPNRKRYTGRGRRCLSARKTRGAGATTLRGVMELEPQIVQALGVGVA